MSALSAVNAISTSQTSSRDGTGISGMDLDGFLKLMIAEMQNQDPLNPMENSEMMQQLSQMRSIGATDKLTGTLDAVLLGQNVTTASGLIGKQISALTDDGSNIEGLVDRVTVAADEGKSATVRIHIGDNAVSLQNIREILSAETGG
jgi:flagellar basal-body rod modification protein FlgD